MVATSQEGVSDAPCQAAMLTGRCRRRDSTFHMRRMTRPDRLKLGGVSAADVVGIID